MQLFARVDIGERVRLVVEADLDDVERRVPRVDLAAAALEKIREVIEKRIFSQVEDLLPVISFGSKKDGETEISLNCAAADLDRFDPVHQFEILRAGEQRNEDPKWDVGVEDIVVAPNYAPTAFGDYAGSLDSDVTISYDRVPKGEIELRHASSVYSADGHHLGSVDAVVVDDGDRLTHLLVERGHLWWKREVALPAEAISKFENDMLTLGLTKGELGKAI